MINFRANLFETNSSSQHCIAVTYESEIYTDGEFHEGLNLCDGYWYLPSDFDYYEFHYDEDFAVLSSFKDKVLYAVASLCGDAYCENTYLDAKDNFIKINNIVCKYIKDCKGLKSHRYSDDDTDYYFGGIDEESSGLLKYFLKQNKLSLEDFLIHKKYIIITDTNKWDTDLYKYRYNDKVYSQGLDYIMSLHDTCSF